MLTTRHCSLFTAIVLLAGCTLARADGDIESRKRVALTVHGQIPAGMADRVRIHLELNLAVAVRSPAPNKTPIEDFDEAVEALAAQRAATNLCLLALTGSTTVTNLRGRVYPKEKIAILNVSRLVAIPSNLEDVTDNERVMRRVEKEAMRAIGHLIGMPPCPSIRCAMRTPRNDAEIDSKGRNFCPPCHQKAFSMLGAHLPGAIPTQLMPPAVRP